MIATTHIGGGINQVIGNLVKALLRPRWQFFHSQVNYSALCDTVQRRYRFGEEHFFKGIGSQEKMH